MSGPQFMPFYIGDYLRDTQHLTTEQHGAYFLLLLACWSRGMLPDDEQELMAIAKISQQKWKKFRRNFDRFFSKKEDGFFHQKRVDKERQHVEMIKNVRSKAGSKGGSKTQANFKQTAKQTSSKRPVATATATATARRVSVREAAKAKPQASTSTTKKPSSEPPARAREGSAGKEEVFLDGNWKPVGRCAPLAASRPERPTAALKARRKELLRQKLLRFVAARLPASDEHAATLGLCGGDPEHSEQWWLDALDIRMRAERWDDTQEFWEGENPPRA